MTTKPLLKAFVFALLVAAIHLAVWALANRELPMINAPSLVNGFSYSGFQITQSPLEKTYPSAAELLQDLKLLRPYTREIRTYSSLDNTEVIALANTLDMQVTAGAWLSGDEHANQREIAALVVKTQQYDNVKRVIVGNEVVLRNDMEIEQLITYLDMVRGQVKVPVSTAEPWHVWLKNPELVKHVDYIAVHLLPYHEGLPVDKAVEYALSRYQELLQTFPRKKILISEVGWPSKGPSIGASVASQVNQALFVREFLAKTAYKNYDYFLIEAFDQPWKINIEGWAGAYWGMFDAERKPKYSLSGAVPKDTRWEVKAAWATALAFLPMMFIAWRFRHWRLGGRLSMGVLLQACITTLVVAWNLPGDYYYTLRDIVILIALIIGMGLTSAVLMTYGVEFSEVLFKGGWRRAFKRAAPVPAEQQKFVSVHLACYNEPPEMVIATIESLVKLDYTHYEVIVVDNNTKDEAKWKPVEAYMAALPENFKFFHLPKWPGFKAGALNFALTKTDPRTEVVGVVDADYVVTPDWLGALVPHFTSAQVAVVQAPQAHRDWENNFFRRMCNWEFEGFFRIGMHHRHERNALIQHGTMTLVRHNALAENGWSEWCICEDTELGLRLLEDGHELRYVDETFGRGLTPANFKALKSQRFRWAFGAMQILKHHFPKLIGYSPLSFGQRYHFLTGWFGWLGDALQLFFTLGSIGWTIAMLAFPKDFSLPVAIMLTPILCFLLVKGAMGPILYRRTMKECGWSDILGASIASLGLSHAIARGVLSGLIRKDGVFKVTAKGKTIGSKLGLLMPIWEETLLLLGLASCSAAMLITRGANNLDAQLWVSMLALQGLPYISTILCQIIAQFPDRAPAKKAAPMMPA